MQSLGDISGMASAGLKCPELKPMKWQGRHQFSEPGRLSKICGIIGRVLELCLREINCHAGVNMGKERNGALRAELGVGEG